MPRFDHVVTVTSAALLLGLSLSFGATAQTVTLGQYQHPKTEKDLNFNKTFMIGVKDGLIAYTCLHKINYFACREYFLPLPLSKRMTL